MIFQPLHLVVQLWMKRLESVITLKKIQNRSILSSRVMNQFCKEFHIVSVEDDPSVAKGIVLSLEASGYRVSHFLNGEAFLSRLDDLHPSLLILDVRLPGRDGFSICRETRSRGFTFPVLMLTARDDEEDKVSGLDDGADDYMVKPFSLKELQSRIKALLRRSYGSFSEQPSQFGQQEYLFGDYSLKPGRMALLKNDEPVDLTPMEFKLLLFFLSNSGHVFHRKEILQNVWSADSEYFGDERTVDVHIRHLRKKIENDPSHPEFLKTQRGEGYFFTTGIPV